MKVRFVSVAERQARARAEAQAVARVKAQGQVPRACGTEMAEAPARGAIRLVTPVARRVVAAPEDAQKPEGGNRVERHDLGFEGRKAAQICDVFDLMAVRARRTQFTRAQIATARRYAGLLERHSKGAMKCSSMESAHSGSGGSGGQGTFMDSYLQEGREIDRLRRRAGDRSGHRRRCRGAGAQGWHGSPGHGAGPAGSGLSCAAHAHTGAARPRLVRLHPPPRPLPRGPGRLSGPHGGVRGRPTIDQPSYK
nr:hypothetical protein [uncultured Celeribacter sp.]